MKLWLLVFILLLLAACATGSVRMVGDAAKYSDGGCEVTVYGTRNEAVGSGMISEVCVVEGSSAFSFDHSVQGAIRNNIKKVCACGVNKAYVDSGYTESNMGIKGVSYVNLVGFE